MNKLFILLILLLLGCTPKLEKALKVVTKTETNAKVGQQEIYSAFPKVPADFAAAVFPVKEKMTVVRDTIRTTVTIPGKRIPCPGVTGADGKTFHSYVQCPDCVYEQTTIRELETRIQENTALVLARQRQINEMEAEAGMSLEQINKQRNEIETLKAEKKTIQNKLTWIYIGVGGLVLLTGLFFLYRILRP